MKQSNHDRNQLPRRLPLRAAVAAVILGFGAQAVAGPESQSDTEKARHSEAYSSPAERSTPSDRTAASDRSATSKDVRSAHSGDHQAEFKLLDEDADGALSKSELKAKSGIDAEKTMDDLDADQNGQLSRTEFAAFEENPAGNRNEVLDAVARQHDSVSDFVEALHEAGMGDALSKSNYTLFAPTNEAFESASGKSLEDLTKEENREELLSLLRAHLVADDVDEDMAKSISQARTIDGGTVELTSEDGKLQIGDATVVESSFQEGTLRVYPIDTVLTPNPERTLASAEDRSSNVAAAGDSRFQELDRNQDGYLSESELNEADDLADRIADGTLDSNDDGRVSRSEFAALEGVESGTGEHDSKADQRTSGSPGARDPESRSRDAWQTRESEYGDDDESPSRDDEQPQP